MAKNVGRVSQSNTSYTYQPGRVGAENRPPAIPFSRILAEVQGTIKPVISHPHMMENVYMPQKVTANEVTGALYGWSYHDLICGTMSFKTMPDTHEKLVQFMERASRDFNRLEATVVREVFAETGLMPRGMSATFTDGGIIHLMSSGQTTNSPEYLSLLAKVNLMFDQKHKKQNMEWLYLLQDIR